MIKDWKRHAEDGNKRPIGYSTQKRGEVKLLVWFALHFKMHTVWNREYFKALGGEIFPKIHQRRVKARKEGHLTIGGAFISRNMIKG